MLLFLLLTADFKVRWDLDTFLLQELLDSVFERHLERSSFVHGSGVVHQAVFERLGVFAQNNCIFELPKLLAAGFCFFVGC